MHDINSNQIISSPNKPIERINKLFEDCNNFSKLSRENGYNTHYLNSWVYTLYSLNREITPKLEKKERHIIEKKFDLFKKLHQLFIVVGEPTQEETLINPSGFIQRWKLCDKIEKKLRDFYSIKTW